jgi:hypothetical protein
LKLEFQKIKGLKLSGQENDSRVVSAKAIKYPRAVKLLSEGGIHEYRNGLNICRGRANKSFKG